MSSAFIEKLKILPPTLVELVRGYAALAPVRALPFPSDVDFDVVHDFLLNDLLLNPLFTKYPPSVQYQAVFWKWALDRLEKMTTSENCEIDARIYEHYVSLMPTAVSQTVGVRPPVPSYVTYLWRDHVDYRSATLLESRTTIESGTTGMKTWLASLVLAQYLTMNPELVQKAHVLELGSGVGLLGIVVATLQISPEYQGGHLTLSDVNDEVLRRCTSNTSLPYNLSSRHPALACTSLDWSDATDNNRLPAFKTTLLRLSPDLIIGADVVYDPSIIEPLVQTIQLGLWGRPTATALIALTVRNEATIAQFVSVAHQYLYVCEVHPQLADTQQFWGLCHDNTHHEQTVKILRLRLKAYA